ncbi:MAG TPA: thioredoxin [Microscillaceae bacterium]|nr:thioredoxin [Microscillaceae bacterium]
MTSKKKNSVKRQLIEWGILLGVLGVLFVTGWHKNVAAGLQQLLLKTGVMQASVQKETDRVAAAYNFQLKTLEGKLVSFEEFKGKTVFMNLWATWCPPCIAEMPDIHELYKEVNSDKVKFVMISLDENPQKAAKFIQRKGYTFPVYIVSGNLPRVYASRSIPTTFVISPQGKIAIKRKGIASYNTRKFKKSLYQIANPPPPKN